MLLYTGIKDLRAYLGKKKEEGRTIGFVPTMGALHEGHLSLVRKSKEECGLTVVSIFVNPIQFNNPRDLEKYPRTLDKDIPLLLNEKCDVIFAPGADEMYPRGEKLPETDLGGLDKVMEGKFRPGHFRGVTIVVKKLFDIVEPDKAYFGKKDFQQLAVIRYMVNILGLPVRIVPCETVREPDGLAMSSRNVRLTPSDRALAPQIYKTLSWAKSQAGLTDPDALAAQATRQLVAIPGSRVEYFEIVDAGTLEPVHQWSAGRPAVACAALSLGDVRLIDNIEVFS